MSIILPYDEKLEHEVGAFITPYGDTILLEDQRHEDFARKYCLGPDYDILTGSMIGPLTSAHILKHLAIEEYQKQLEHFDAFSSSKLSVKDLDKLKLWLNSHNGINTYSDFLVYALSYDKVERKVSKLITSTAADKHLRFFNYYLMDWRVENPEETILFRTNSSEYNFTEKDLSYQTDEDADAEEEIKAIRSGVPLAKRPLYFR